jgi:probable rRNA maturation factor
MPVFVQSRVRFVRFNRPVIARLASAILSLVGESSSALGVTFVGDRRMRQLNRQYRKKDQTTDVLAFDMREGPSGDSLSLGDVVIAAPTAWCHARKENRSLDEEVAALLIHGILHLCGYDHEQDIRQARRMYRRERMNLKKLGQIPALAHGIERRGRF